MRSGGRGSCRHSPSNKFSTLRFQQVRVLVLRTGQERLEHKEQPRERFRRRSKAWLGPGFTPSGSWPSVSL